MNSLPQFISQEDWDSNRQYIKLDTGITIDYVEMGNPDGPVLILQHGMTDNNRVWSLSAPYYAEAGYHVFMLDLRGMGYSDEPNGFYTPMTYAQDIYSFLKQKGINEIYYVGHSLGSFVGQAFLAMYPHMLKKIVLVASGPLGGRSQTTKIYEMAKALKEDEHPSDSFIDLWYGGQDDVDQDFLSRVKKESQQLKANSWINIAGGMAVTDFSKIYPLIDKSVPMLMLFGSKDYMLDDDMQKKIKEIFSHAETITYDGIGHNIQYCIPKKSAEDIINFLKK